jgi:hypothetical protein
VRTEGAPAGLVFASLYAQLSEALKGRRDVVHDTCSLRASERTGLLWRAHHAGWRAVLVLFGVGARTCRIRDSQRDMQASGVDWEGSRRLMASAAHSAEREGWDAVLWVPRRMPGAHVFR